MLNTAGAISSRVAGTNSTITNTLDSINHTVDTIAYVDDLQVAEKEAIENGYDGIVKVA